MKLFRVGHVVSIVLLFCTVASAQSPRQQQRKETDGQRQGSYLVVPPPPAKNPIAPPPQPKDPKREPYDWLKWRYDWLAPNVLTQLGLIGAAIWAGCLALGTLREIRKEVSETAKAAKAAEDSATATAGTLATNKEIERAYITLGHNHVILANSAMLQVKRSMDRGRDDDPDAVELVVMITNKGNTPGDVLGGFYGFIHETAATGPDLRKVQGRRNGGGHLTRLFLHPKKTVSFSAAITLGSDEIAKLTSIQAEHEPDATYLWFVGEVDYKDRFKTVHRCGYCRRYSAASGGFLFGPETGPLNYDRLLGPEEIAQRGYRPDPD